MFLHVEPTETVLELKQKIQSFTDTDDKPGGVPVDRQRLLMGPTFASVLEVRGAGGGRGRLTLNGSSLDSTGGGRKGGTSV